MEVRSAPGPGDQMSDDIEQRAADAIEAKIKPRLRRETCPYCDNMIWFMLDQTAKPSAI